MERNYSLPQRKDSSEDYQRLGILQVGALGLPVSRKLLYAGTERVVQNLDDVFVKEGHHSVVAAPGDSDISGKLFATIPQSLWQAKNGSGGRDILFGDEAYAHHYDQIIDYVSGKHSDNILISILRGYGEISVVHDHPGYGLVNSDEFWNRRSEWPCGVPILTTNHGKFVPEFENKYQMWRNLKAEGHPIYFNAISFDQKERFERNTGVEIDGVIYHGVPLELFPFNDSAQDYLFSLGRICPEKGQHLAIEVARRTGMPLIIGGEVHSVNEDYFNEKVRPYLTSSIDIKSRIYEGEARNWKRNVLEKIAAGEKVVEEGEIIFIGGLNDQEKSIVYGNARATLMPITWPEPFGLVMIESMATGTPVIGYEFGSVPEVISDGESGYVIPQVLNDDGSLDEEAMVEQTVESLENLGRISRLETRIRVEEKFTAQREAEQYLELYREIMGIRRSPLIKNRSLNEAAA